MATMTYFSNIMAKRLAVDEKDKMSLWANAYSVIGNESTCNDTQTIALEIISKNETIPLLIVDSDGNEILTSRNIRLPKHKSEEFLQKKLEEYKENDKHPPIEVTMMVSDGLYTQYIYYGKSNLLKQLSLFPIWQAAIIGLFLGLFYYFMNLSRRSEENRVWVGLSKETAHQLGTPISSLFAWIDLMRTGHSSPEMFDEMQKDVTRLEKVANRFSKIGSKTTLELCNLSEVLDASATYMSTRISRKVKINKCFSNTHFIPVMLNNELFDWVVENLIKNAVDAMRGGGDISIHVSEDEKNVIIDFEDQGKGIAKNKFKEVFRPGVSTKKRGWGLGLSFAKRIINNYHKGEIFVKKSELEVGTTIRIILPKCEKSMTTLPKKTKCLYTSK